MLNKSVAEQKLKSLYIYAPELNAPIEMKNYCTSLPKQLQE